METISFGTKLKSNNDNDIIKKKMIKKDKKDPV